MELRTRRLMFTLGGSILLSLGVLAACSSDSSFSSLPGTTTPVDSGKKVTDSGDDDTGDETEDQDSGTSDAGCSNLRTSARQYCFGARALDDAGSGCSTANATAPEVCCTDEKVGTTFTPAKCAATTTGSNGYETGKCGFQPASADAGGREFHCLESRHCPSAASQCCLIKGTGGSNPTATADKNFPASCNQFYNGNSGFFVGGTRCKDECDTGEVHLCGKDEDCDTGESCYFFSLGNGNSARFTGVCKTTIK